MINILAEAHRLQIEYMCRDPEYDRDYQEYLRIQDRNEVVGNEGSNRDGISLRRSGSRSTGELGPYISRMRLKYGLLDLVHLPEPWTITKEPIPITYVSLGVSNAQWLGRQANIHELTLYIDIRCPRRQLVRAIEGLIRKEQEGMSQHRRPVKTWGDYLDAWDLRERGMTGGQMGLKLNVHRNTALRRARKAHEIIESQAYKEFTNTLRNN